MAVTPPVKATVDYMRQPKMAQLKTPPMKKAPPGRTRIKALAPMKPLPNKGYRRAP